MQKRTVLFFLVIFICNIFFSLSIYSQDTIVNVTDSLLIIKKSEFISISPNNEENDYDTSKIDMFDYKFFIFGSDFVSYTGNIGSASKFLYFNSESNNLKFSPGFDSYNSYFTRDILYYRVTKPLTEIKYINGSKNENYFSVFHTQNTTNNFNFSLHYNLISSDGLYYRQKTKNSNFGFSSHYKTNNQIYELKTFFFYDRINNELNGGIINDSVFENNIEATRDVIGVNLSYAEAKLIHSTGGLEHSLKLVGDSNTNIVLKHTSNYQNFVYRYNDDLIDKNYYNYYYDDSSVTSDKSVYDILFNTFELKSSLNSKLFFNAGTCYDIIKINQANISNSTYDSKILFKLYTKDISKINFRLSSIYGIKGYNESNYENNFTINYALTKDNQKKTNISFDANDNRFYKSYNNYIYVANNILRASNISPTKELNVGLYFNFEQLINIEAKYYNFTDYKYFFANVEQLQTDNAEVISFKLKNKINIGNFVLKSNIAFQESNSNLINLPQLMLKETFLYNNYAFNKKLFYYLGIDAYWFSEYYADAFNPYSSDFYAQDKKKIGNYPYFDIFLGLKIKRFDAFVKLEHFNAGFMGYNYYQLPSYPTNDRTFKFGLNWRFYN